MSDEDEYWQCGNCGATNVKGTISCEGCGGMASIVREMKNFPEARP